MKNLINKITGSFYGSAIGDGFGYTTEFMPFEHIQNQWGINGLTEPQGDPILVTDDTQMAIAVGKALMESYDNHFSLETFKEKLKQRFIEWLNDPENDRAPGNTCLTACENLEKGMPWTAATIKNSKGCGANMRVLPVGYFKFKNDKITDAEVAKIAQLQAAMTHGHPTALAASDLTAMAVVKILEGLPQSQLLEFLMDYAHSQKEIYHGDFLENVWERPLVKNEIKYIERGWIECIDALQKVKEALQINDKISDPCVYTGEGWIAEEALATALLCFLFFPEKPQAVLRKAVNTGGDSDSIACLAGGFVGAYCGIEALPEEWVNRIEYQEEMNSFLEFIKN